MAYCSGDIMYAHIHVVMNAFSGNHLGYDFSLLDFHDKHLIHTGKA